MPIKIYTELEPAPEQEFICLMGGGGSGKSRLACSIVRANPQKYGPKALLVAFDPGSEGMPSVIPEDKQNIIVAKLVAPAYGERAEMVKVWDPYQDMVDLITGDLPNMPEVGTIILDTMTYWAGDLLQAIANSGRFSDKHVIIESKGAGKLAMPMQGDYGAAQFSIMRVLKFLENSGKHVVGIFHEGIYEPDGAPGEAIFGGPATVGKAGIRPIAQMFHSVIRLEAKTEGGMAGKGGELKYKAYTAPKGIWNAKLRSSGGNPMPVVELKVDPVHFWHQYDAVIKESKK